MVCQHTFLQGSQYHSDHYALRIPFAMRRSSRSPENPSRDYRLPTDGCQHRWMCSCSVQRYVDSADRMVDVETLRPRAPGVRDVSEGLQVGHLLRVLVNVKNSLSISQACSRATLRGGSTLSGRSNHPDCCSECRLGREIPSKHPFSFGFRRGFNV